MFLERTSNDIHYSSFVAWDEEGLMHGFGNDSLNMVKEFREEAHKRFCRAFEVSELLLPVQAHTDHVCQLDGGSVSDTLCEIHQQLSGSPADAILVRHVSRLSKRIAIGVVTADCVPLLIRSRHSRAVVHAGWRGIAQGIVLKVCSLIRESEPEGSIEVLAGPCAGAADYEVGPEVIEALGHCVVAEKREGERYNLDLTGSIEKQIALSGLQCSIFTLRRSTMAPQAPYYSYRRDGAAAGRNLSFMICGR